MYVRWSTEEDSYLESNYEKMPIKNIAEHLGKTDIAVKRRAARLNLKSGRNMSDSDIDYITNAYSFEGKSMVSIAAELGRHRETIQRTISAYGIKSKLEIASEKCQPGYKVCSKCYGEYPEDDDHFTKSRGKLLTVCKVCDKLRKRKKTDKLYIEKKKCSICGESKALVEFSKKRNGHTAACKSCLSEANRQYRVKN